MKRANILSCSLMALSLGIAAPAVGAGDPVAGKTKSAVCSACHGEGGANSLLPIYPILAGQHADYLAKALADYKSGARKDPVMAGMAAALSDQDMLDLAAYFASQKGLVTPSAK